MSAIEQVQIPEKLFYRINEVATITQVKPYVLRYWESEFPMLAPEKDENDQRRYRKSDIELILHIKRLLYDEKFTIAGARRQLKQAREQHSPSPAASAPVQPAVQPPATPVKVDLARYRRLNKSLLELRKDVSDIYNLLG